ncbi:MAG: hypothetical protein ACI4K9_08685 [Candidatus Fimenecus sp.]
MKKACSAVLCILLCFALQLGVFAESMELKTIVPDQHEITITYNEGGYVLYEDEVVPSGTTLVVPRHGGFDLTIICGADSHLESVTVNNEDVTGKMVYGRLYLDDVYTDLNIIFSFEACAGEDPTPGDPPTGDPDAPPQPAEDDPCHRMALQGGVYSGDQDTPLPEAKLVFDFGELEITADEDGQYTLPVIKDGRHSVEIENADGEVVGRDSFVIDVRPDATETTVETLEDGTQVVIVPEGTALVYLDFIVNADGSVTVVPGNPEPAPEVPPSDIGEIIKDNPVIIKTGALIRENPVEAAVLFGFAFFLLLFLIVRRRKKDEENDEQTA